MFKYVKMTQGSFKPLDWKCLFKNVLHRYNSVFYLSLINNIFVKVSAMSRYTAGLVFLYYIHAVIFRPKLIICLIKIRPTTDRIHKTSIQITICVIKWPTLTMLWHVRNIFSAVHKPKCVHEYINKNSINKNNNDTFKDDLETDAIST